MAKIPGVRKLRAAVLTAAAVVLLVDPVIARASESAPPAVDPAVAFVTTGCGWSSGDREGMVRVVVLSEGFEHVTSRVFFQWLAESRDERPEVVRSEAVSVINEPGVWSVGQPVVHFDAEEGCTFRLPATNSYTFESTEFVVKVALSGEPETKQVDDGHEPK